MTPNFGGWDEGRLQAALEAGEFVLHFQPRIDLQNGRITGAEALVRHRDDEGRLTLPEHFVPLFERHGLIRRLTPWVLDRALEALPDLLAAAGERFTLSINLSARDCDNGHFHDRLRGCIEGREDLIPHISFEITETSLLDAADEVVRKLCWLRDMGFGLAIDDFGAGHASLEMLSRFPFTELKIDGGFIQRMLDSERNARIIDSAVAMAHHLNMASVAERIEHESHHHFLRNVGCEEGQGHLFGPAMPLPNFLIRIRESVVHEAMPAPVGFVCQVVLDHIRWHRNFLCNVAELHEARREGRTPRFLFPLAELDAEDCRLGRWMQRQSGERWLADVTQLLGKPHDELHAEAERIWKMAVRGTDGESLANELWRLAGLSNQLVRFLYDLEYTALSGRIRQECVNCGSCCNSGGCEDALIQNNNKNKAVID